LRLYQESFHGQKYLQGVKDAPWCQDCHGSHDIKSVNDPQSITYRLNIPKMCAVCHQNPQIVKRYRIPVKEPYKIYQQSIHGMAIEKMGLIKAAVCSDCHGSHTLRRASDPQSEIYKYNVPQTCGKCHFGIWKTYEESVHGKALADKLPNAPTCTDCHGEHNIITSTDTLSKVYPRNIPKTCSFCHAEETLASKYGLSSLVYETYQESFHGIANKYGLLTVANCASCHGSHDILPSTDPLSSIHPNNLVQTCGKCHKNASQSFAQGKIHLPASQKSSWGVYITKKLYPWLIAILFFIFLIYTLFDLFGMRKVS